MPSHLADPVVNPYRDDPVFKSKKALRTYFAQNTSSSDSSGEEMQTEIDDTPAAVRETCVCGECEDIRSREGFHHKCCGSYKARIKDKKYSIKLDFTCFPRDNTVM